METLESYQQSGIWTADSEYKTIELPLNDIKRWECLLVIFFEASCLERFRVDDVKMETVWNLSRVTEYMKVVGKTASSTRPKKPNPHIDSGKIMILLYGLILHLEHRGLV